MNRNIQIWGCAIGTTLFFILATNCIRYGRQTTAILQGSGALTAVLREWKGENRPSGPNLTRILNGVGTFKPFEYTNRVTSGTQEWYPRFGINSSHFIGGRILVIDENEIIVLVTSNHHAEVIIK